MDLLLNQADVHHLYPKKHLATQQFKAAMYNQIANYVVAQSEINIAIGAKDPKVYFEELLMQCAGGDRKYGAIDKREDLIANLEANCVPVSMLYGNVDEYDVFLEERRKLMALKIKAWFEVL
jgi:hypothetical protein